MAVEDKFNYKNKNEWDKLPKLVMYDLVQNHRELDKAEKDLEGKRARLQERNTLLDGKWSQITENKSNLKKLFQSSKKIVEANRASIVRFSEIINEHKRLQESLDAHIEELQTKKVNVKSVMSEMEKYVCNYSVFEEFLEGVAEKGSGFNSVGDVINRYACLDNLRQEFAKKLDESLEDIIDARKEVVNISENKYSLLRDLNNNMIKKQLKLKTAKERNEKWQNNVERIKLLKTDKSQEMDLYFSACWNLYNTVLARKQQTERPEKKFEKSKPTVKLSKYDISGQLDYIKNSIEFYKQVLQLATLNIKS